MPKTRNITPTTPVKVGKQQAERTVSVSEPRHVETPTSAKKKKKKKGKGKAPETELFSNVGVTTMHNTAYGVHNGEYMYEDEDLVMEEGMADYDSYVPRSFARSRTGLSPDLQSVHLSTTASLASLTAGTRYCTGHHDIPTDDYRAEHVQLLAELTKKVEMVASEARAGNGDVRESLEALPKGLRSFMQNALSKMADMGLGAEEMKQHAMYAIAQHCLGPELGMPPSGYANSNGTDGDDGGRHAEFDQQALSELTLQKVFERLFSGKVPGTTRGGGGGVGQTALHANVVLSHEFMEDGDLEGEEDEEFSDDDEGFGMERRMDFRPGGLTAMSRKTVVGTLPTTATTTTTPGTTRPMTTTGSMRGEYMYSEGLPAVPEMGTEGVTEKRKKKKKRKSRVGFDNPRVEIEPGLEAGVIPDMESDADCDNRAAAERETEFRSSLAPHPTSNSPSTMPPARNPPPPSSRAAGKQPMSYAAPPPQTQSAQTNTTLPRSARAAGKAPAPPPQAYPNHHTQHTQHTHQHPSPPVSNASVSQKHRQPAGSQSANPNPKSNSKIWSTNTSEERERIKEFWLGLGEEERRALVKVEKEAVLRKMKEQQKHSCTCAVCGRKRSAIEEELEVLYDAYYEELEQYANYQQQYVSSGGTIPPPPGPGPFPGSVELDKNGVVVGPGGKTHSHNHPPNARTKALTNGPRKGTESEYDEDDPDGEEYEDEDEFDEEEEDEEEDVDPDDDIGLTRNGAPRHVEARDRGRGAPNGTKGSGRDSLFNFGSSFTVAGPGNILTVADDLLKNDGQKFLEMMEQLAERRMQREEDAAADVEDDSEEEEDEEGDEEDEGEDEDDDEEDEEEEVMTEAQKMEEGRRMFSIFAARMFEQRVLSAYREKVSQERQNQLLRELEEEQAANKQKEEKKQKENLRKKNKKKLQRQAKVEEKAAKAKEKAAGEALQKEKQRQAEEEQRKKREEERQKREAARKAAEEEKQRRDEERRKRLAEEKELQAERERKKREKEQKAREERREREEKERKAKEEREAKLAAERVEKARKEQQEKEEREKRLAKEKEEREAKERLAQQQQQAQAQARAAATAASKAHPPTSPHANATASSSQRQQPPVSAPKKVLNKPTVQPLVAPLAPAAPIAQQQRQPSRPTMLIPVPSPLTPQHPQHPQSSQHSSPTAPTNIPTTPVFPQSAPVSQQPTLSPRSQYPAAQALGPSPIPRGFGSGPPFEPGFGRGLAPAAPIGPPKVATMQASISTPVMNPGPTVPVRRMSSAADPGPITRPIAPIARPTNGINGDHHSSSSAPGSGGASPSRRSPSPKGVLGSSALAADDDEVVTAPPRRVVPAPVGQVWHSPRSSAAINPPWGNPPPGASFSPPQRVLPGGVNTVGTLAGLGAIGVGMWNHQAPGPGPGPGPQNPGAIGEWAAATQPGHPFFAAGNAPYLHHHTHSTATPPHSSGN